MMFPLIVSATCNNYTKYQITTGSKKGTYYQIGKDLAKYVAPDACIKLEVLNSNGSIENSKNLRSPKFPKLKFAIVQNDVLQALKKAADAGDTEAKNLVDNLRVLTPLYNEEIHIISKVKSGIKTYSDLKDKVISIGKAKSGTAMTSLLLYKELFGKRLKKFQLESFDDALLSLNKGDVDAIIKVGGQPLERLSKDMTKEMDKYIQLVKYDKGSSKHYPIVSYYSETIKKENYPWLLVDTPTLSTKAFLITFNYTQKITQKNLKRFIESFKKHLSEMQRSATVDISTPHLKWKQVSNSCAPMLQGGWEYYKVINDICGGVGTSNFMKASGLSVHSCTEFDKAAGLCK